MSRLRRAIAGWLHRLADRIMPPIPGTLEAGAIARVRWAQTLVGSTGQYRRHAVFSALRKEFPNMPDRDIAFVIERVIREGRHERPKRREGQPGG